MNNTKCLVLAAILVFSSGYVFAAVIGNTNAEVQAIAEPVLDNILLGFEKNDYVTYAKDFDTTLKESVSESQFLKTDQWYDTALGPLVSKEFLGSLQQGQMSVVLWKGKFEYSENDVLIKLVMSRRGDSYVVTGLWFQ